MSAYCNQCGLCCAKSGAAGYQVVPQEGQEMRVCVTKPRIVIQRDLRFKNAIAFLPAKVIPGKYVNAKILVKRPANSNEQ